MTAVKNTVTALSKPLDGLYTVRGRDSWHPSITCILYSRNHIWLWWPALADPDLPHHIPVQS
jgi:hypothetical protein